MAQQTGNQSRLQRFSRIIPVISGLFLLAFALMLCACGSNGSGTLLSDVGMDNSTLSLDGKNLQNSVNLNYTIGKEATVNLNLDGPGNSHYQIRKDEGRPAGQYSANFSGLVNITENGLVQTRLLPNGTYHYTLSAASGQENTNKEGLFEISGNITETAPEISGLSAYPAVISPNFDAIDDNTTLNWVTSKPATVTVAISGPNSFNKTLKTMKNEPAQEDNITFNGLDLQNKPLPDGIYTFTITAADAYGQVTRRANTLEIKGGGLPQVQITQVDISPTQIIKGNEVTIKVRVKNRGTVPVRSKGPDSGYTYSTRDVFSSIEGGKYDEEAGYWRIGVDFEANGGSGAIRYPWRWGFGKEYLMPGEEVEITGKIKIERPEQKIVLYAGLLQEKIALPQDHLKITQIQISY